MKSYSEMIQIPTFMGRVRYLQIAGSVGIETFGFDRYLNQVFYKSKEWHDLRHKVIARDLGRDLAMEGYDIHQGLLVHHINPIAQSDILNRSDLVLDLDNLVTTTHRTHNAIHFGTDLDVLMDYTPRTPGDTILW